MASHRFEADAAAGPAREGVPGGRALLLVRVRLFDGPGVADGPTGEPAGQEDVYTDLRRDAARDLAFRLLEQQAACRNAPAQRARPGGPALLWPSSGNRPAPPQPTQNGPRTRS